MSEKGGSDQGYAEAAIGRWFSQYLILSAAENTYNAAPFTAKELVMTETTEAWAADLMDRQGVAKFLLHYLDSDPSLKVMNLNSPWGSGKTFFIANWMAELKGTRHCIYFNAWEHDYTGDPFISLTAVMHDQMYECLSARGQVTEQLKTFSE